jgi:hypothetical protein
VLGRGGHPDRMAEASPEPGAPRTVTSMRRAAVTSTTVVAAP